MFSLRRDARNRLIIGSMGTIIGGSGGLSDRWTTQMLKQFFPNLGAVEFDAAWAGKIAISPDHLPRIHRLATGFYMPIGYNGRGITTGTLFGRAMADLLKEKNESNLPLLISEPHTYFEVTAINQFLILHSRRTSGGKAFKLKRVMFYSPTKQLRRLFKVRS